MKNARLWIALLLLRVAVSGCATTGFDVQADDPPTAAPFASTSVAPTAPSAPQIVEPATGGAPVIANPIGGSLYMPVTGGAPVFGNAL